jgi:hypothetical protein
MPLHDALSKTWEIMIFAINDCNEIVLLQAYMYRLKLKVSPLCYLDGNMFSMSKLNKLSLNFSTKHDYTILVNLYSRRWHIWRAEDDNFSFSTPIFETTITLSAASWAALILALTWLVCDKLDPFLDSSINVGAHVVGSCKLDRTNIYKETQTVHICPNK